MVYQDHVDWLYVLRMLSGCRANSPDYVLPLVVLSFLLYHGFGVQVHARATRIQRWAGFFAFYSTGSAVKFLLIFHSMFPLFSESEQCVHAVCWSGVSNLTMFELALCLQM